MKSVYLQGVGVIGPGLCGWENSRAVLAGEAPCLNEPLPRLAPDLLPATERRRSSETVRLAVTVAQEAMRQSRLPLDKVATVFASSDGDGQTLHHICEALATPERDVSPTRFHNSVHNAAAGYWSIATGSRLPSNSLCAYDVSFAAGLLDAVSQIVVEDETVLLVAFDLPFPEPLHAVRKVECGFAAAFVLAPRRDAHTLTEWEIALQKDGPPPIFPDVNAWASNPAARALPLLALLAQKRSGTVRLDYLHDMRVVVKCSA